MKTAVILLIKYESPTVPLVDVCNDYFGLDVKAAKERALNQQLPVPVFRMTNSQKSPWLIHINDLAAYIDSQAELARKDFKNLHD